MDRGIVAVVASIALLVMAPAASGALPHQEPPAILDEPDPRSGDDGGAPASAPTVSLGLADLVPAPGSWGAGTDSLKAPPCRPDDGIEPSITFLPEGSLVRSPTGECQTPGTSSSRGTAGPSISTGVAPDRARQPDRSAGTASDGQTEVAPTGWTREATPPSHVPVVAGLIALAAWILYRRLTRDRVLDNDLRRRVRDLVDDAPGVTAARIADELDVHYDTVRHHLRVLDEFDEIRVDRFGSTRRYFPNHGRYTADDRALLAALRVEPRRRALETLARDGGLSSGELAEAIGVAPSTASHHLAELEAAGLVERTRDGRSVRCELTQAAKAGLRMFG